MNNLKNKKIKINLKSGIPKSNPKPFTPVTTPKISEQFSIQESIKDIIKTAPRDSYPINILSLNIRDIITYTIKSILETINDSYDLYNDKKITIMNLVSVLIKRNRILYIGIGFILVSIMIYIINNVIRIPFIGFGGDKKVFINNY